MVLKPSRPSLPLPPTAASLWPRSTPTPATRPSRCPTPRRPCSTACTPPPAARFWPAALRAVLHPGCAAGTRRALLPGADHRWPPQRATFRAAVATPFCQQNGPLRTVRNGPFGFIWHLHLSICSHSLCHPALLPLAPTPLVSAVLSRFFDGRPIDFVLEQVSISGSLRPVKRQ